MSRRAKIIVVLVIGVPVLLHLVYALWASPLTAYYVTVGELLNTSPLTGGTEGGTRTVRVGGEVMAGSIAWDSSRGELGFVLTDGTRQLPVVYPGPAPDLLRAGVTAIVTGRLEEGRFLAQELLLKCPHEYVDA
ncbi:MAG: cytochrome c maturation protein CcmE [Anaerolineae bacterium]